ncbi:MAG: DUF502 domain-containing protein [Halanaeroarchaeum sp.]
MVSTGDVARSIRNGFVTGLVVVAPLVVTAVVLSIVYGWIVGLVNPVLSIVFAEVGLVENVIGLVVLGVVLTAIGTALREGAGDGLVMEFDRIMEQVPVIRAIYSPTREASTALLEHGEQFERVALVEWPRADLHTVGFVTDETPTHVARYLGDEEPHYDVFVPMSPNPMGGFLAIVPESRLVTTDLSVQEGLEMVVTTGLSGEEEFNLD